ncbi:tetratricopeptide repeat protein 16-like [Gigantopelta aegis]|uniref:tetratricopeptide repeat protein 16-like n=1 Tax=Gigantopelta aegis TaxID=1735272 RepID=UPI001B88A0E8|nr:tetratricopeptide repeat protein 16-like [Gigantopelta aegis]XP_041368203.1 tetratricopeptide repeat protein 16-like [Gigantopelta aegis]
MAEASKDKIVAGENILNMPEFQPQNVNVHQFYPELAHNFDQNSTKFLKNGKESKVTDPCEDVEQEELDAEYGTSGPLVTVEINDNNSADNDPQPDFDAEEEEEAGVFPTAVDEETLDAAKARQKSIFTTENWQSPVNQINPGMQEIIDETMQQHLDHAVQLKENGEHQAALLFLNKAISLVPNNPGLYVQRAENYIQLCDFQSAILNLKKTCLLDPHNDDCYVQLAFLYFFEGQTLFDKQLYPEALESFSRAAEMQPNNIGYHIRSISCLAALQRHGECLALINKRLEIDSSNPDLYIMRARLHEMFRNTTLSYYDVKDALTINDNHFEAKEMMSMLEKRAADYKSQAMNLSVLGKNREALQKISVAIETNPAVADFHVHRGALHRKLHDFNAAIDDFLLALDKCEHNEEDPVYSDAQRQLLLTYNDFAVECFQKSFYDEAIILLNKAIKGEKNEKGLYVNRGDCFFKQNELNFALQDYQQALELDASDLGVKARIAVVQHEFGIDNYQNKNYVVAQTKFTLAIQYNPRVGQFYISRARTRYMMENSDGARQDLVMGLLLDPSNEDIVSILSRLFPGKSVADVIDSPAAAGAQRALHNLVSTVSPVRLQPLPANRSDEFDDQCNTEASSPTHDSPVVEISRGLSSLKSCITDKDFNLKFINQKKKANYQVKDALLNRKPLKNTHPRIQPLPPAVQSSERSDQKPGSWRTFSLGIGIK